MATSSRLTVREEALEAFRGSLRGDLVRPDDAGYDAARRVYNAMIDKHPALIARCQGVADVIGAVNFARDNNLLVAVRGGGHNVAGNAVCDGGLVIDLSRMRSIRVDPVASHRPRRARGDLPGVRPRDATLRPGDARRDDLRDGDRRPDARRRVRLAVAPARARLRQPALRRYGAGRRPFRHRQRGGARGPLLGRARRRRQLRHRHLVRIPAPPGRDAPRRVAGPPARASARGAPVLPRFHRHRAG